MKILIDKNTLYQLSSAVQRAASNKDTVPVLSGLLIEASDNHLSMTATDLEIGIKKRIGEVNILEEGKVLVNARYFNDLVRYLPEGEVSLSLDYEKAKLDIKYGRSSTSLNILNHEEFPDLPLDKNINLCQIPQITLKECVKKTSFAAAASHFKPVFTGILFDFDSDPLTVVASDTHRLAIFTINSIEKNVSSGQYIVPARTLNELVKVLDDDDEEIIMGQAENNVVFYKKDEKFFFLSRLIEGKYPKYEQVVPKNYTNSYTMEAADLAQSLERAVLLPSDAKTIKHVRLDFDKDLRISAYSEKMGELSEYINLGESKEQKEISISFNTRYLLDIVKILGSESNMIEMDLTGAMSPAVIRNSENDNYLHVLVPLRTG